MYVLFERGFWWSCVVILLRPREISVSRKTWFCRPIFMVSSRGSKVFLRIFKKSMTLLSAFSYMMRISSI